MSTDSRQNRKRFSETYKRIFGDGHKETGTFVMREGKLVRAHGGLDALRKHDSKNIKSLSLGVQTAQIPQATQDITEAGLAGDMRYAADGDAIFKDRRAKLRCMKKLGYFDRDEVRG